MKPQSSIAGKEVAQLSSGGHIAAIVPTTIEQVFRLAELIHQSGLAPYQLKSPAAVTVVLLKGLETGLPPMSALECIGVINGKACLHSDGIPALLWARGFKIREWYEGAGDTLVAKCTITRPDGTEYAGEFSVQDAKDARLWDTREKVKRKIDGEWKEVPNDAPWHRYSKRMIKMRARIWTARDSASDVLKGIPIFEEQADVELSRSEYSETKPAVLPVPTDISDGTETVTATVTEAEATQVKPEAEEPSAILMAYEEVLKACTTEAAVKKTDKTHKADLDTLDADLGKAAEEIRARELKRIRGGDKPSEQGELV